MTDHDVPPVAHGHVAGLDALGDGADLVDFEEQRVAHLLLQRNVDSFDVGDEQVIADDLACVGDLGHDLSLRLEVVLVERVFDGDHIVIFSKVDIHVDQFLS